MSSDTQLQSFIDRVRALGRIASETAKEAAPLVEAVLRKTAAAGTNPDGKPWPLTKDGARALPDAASAISATAKGSVVQVKLRGKYAFHNYGTRRDPQRQIIPDGGAGTPVVVAKAVEQAARVVFERTMRGG